MAQAISSRSLSAEARFQTQISPYGMCDEKCRPETGFPAIISVFPVSYHTTNVS
jgi:hypothetical protein